jgi:hypothetical protein
MTKLYLTTKPGASSKRGTRAWAHPVVERPGYSTVTLLARLRGWSTSFPRISATW